jgi:enamine deaminase RidA (YjgF/YER057c/UK114 family)
MTSHARHTLTRRSALGATAAALVAPAALAAPGAATPAERLKALGIVLPPPPRPIALFSPFVRDGTTVMIAGQVPFVDGKVLNPGLVPTDVSVEQAVAAARQCALQILSLLQQACEGDLGRVRTGLMVTGWVACTPTFTQHPSVINGASQLLLDVLGEAGRHARAAVGAPSLPLNASVEVAASFALRG